MKLEGGYSHSGNITHTNATNYTSYYINGGFGGGGAALDPGGGAGGGGGYSGGAGGSYGGGAGGGGGSYNSGANQVNQISNSYEAGSVTIELIGNNKPHTHLAIDDVKAKREYINLEQIIHFDNNQDEYPEHVITVSSQSSSIRGGDKLFNNLGIVESSSITGGWETGNYYNDTGYTGTSSTPASNNGYDEYLGEWAQVYYRRTTTIDKMIMYAPGYTTFERMPSDFRLYGSLDGIEWVMIKEWTEYTRQHWYPDGIVWPYTSTKRILPVEFVLDNQVSYPYFRIAVNKATFTSRGTGNTSLFIREIEFYLGDNQQVLYETLNSGALDVHDLPEYWGPPYFYKEPVNYFFPKNSLIFNDIYISPGMGDTPIFGLIHPEFETANAYVNENNINISKISPYMKEMMLILWHQRQQKNYV